jgi:hypothetical protein
VRHDPLVNEWSIQRLQLLLGLLHLVNATHLERKVMKTRVPPLEPAFPLLPEGQHQLVIFPQEDKSTPFFPRFSDHCEPENLLVEPLGTI